MIALLAAVPEETDLIRETLTEARPETVNGIEVHCGRISANAVCLAHAGIGKAAAAATAITLLSHYRPRVLCLFGCGGAYPGSRLALGDLALASAEIFGDEGVCTSEGFRDLQRMGLPMRKMPQALFNLWPIDAALHDWARDKLAEYAKTARVALGCGPFVTLSSCTGTAAKAAEIAQRTAAICENMEGAAVVLACRQMAVPMLEVRGISNLVDDYDPGRWDLAAGMAAAQKAILNLLKEESERWPIFTP